MSICPSTFYTCLKCSALQGTSASPSTYWARGEIGANLILFTNVSQGFFFLFWFPLEQIIYSFIFNGVRLQRMKVTQANITSNLHELTFCVLKYNSSKRLINNDILVTIGFLVLTNDG